MNYSFSSVSCMCHHIPEQRSVIQEKKKKKAKSTIQLNKAFKEKNERCDVELTFLGREADR